MSESENTCSSIKGDGTPLQGQQLLLFSFSVRKNWLFYGFFFWCGLEVDGLDKDSLCDPD